jgi:hypothetical protein
MPLRGEAALRMYRTIVRDQTRLTKPDSFAHVARTPDGIEEVADDSQGREQDLLGGRCGTRTHDLSRVNPFRYAAREDDERRNTA